MLELQVPLYPPWQPPPLPAVTLQQLIPKREFVKKEERPTASQAFQSQVQAAATQLAVDYHKVSLRSWKLLCVVNAAYLACFLHCWHKQCLTLRGPMGAKHLKSLGCLPLCNKQGSEN